MKNITTIKSSAECNMQYEVFNLGNSVTIEKPEEHQKLIDELGLVGQKKMIIDQGDKIIPFPLMNVTDRRVWSHVLPEVTNLEEYEAGLIPYEVLELLAMCKTKKYFDVEKRFKEGENYYLTKGYIEIWGRPKDQIDLIAVGVIKTTYGKTETEREDYLPEERQKKFLLARWGHELKPFSEVVKDAKESWKESRLNKIMKSIRDYEAAKDNIDSDADNYFAGQYVSTIW